jgi:hypothetical protein
MTTYYVSPTGSNTSPYDTWAKAANVPHTVAALNPAGGPHTIYIAAGDYASYLLFSNSAWNGSVVIGTTADGSTTPATKGQVTINVIAGYYGYSGSSSNMTISYLSIVGGDASHANIYLSGTGTTFNEVYSLNATANTVYTTGGTHSFNRSTFAGSATNRSIHATGATNLTFNDCDIRNNGSLVGGVGYAIHNQGTGDVVLNNCMVLGSGAYAICNSSTGSITATNSILAAGWKTSVAAVFRADGAIHLINNLVVGNWWNHATVTGTLATDTGNIYTSAPMFTQRSAPAFLGLAIDDTTNIDYVELIEPILAARGLKATWFINANTLTGDTLTRAAALLSRGTITIGGHGWDHSKLTATVAYSITKVGATISVDRVADTITINPGGVVTGFRAKSLATIETELIALGCTVGALPAQVFSTLLGEVWADSAGPQASPYTPPLLLDATAATGFFKVQIADCKTYMESVLTGYTGKSFASPYGATTADAEAAVKAAGYLSMRNSDTTRCEWVLSNYDIYQGMHIGVATIKGATEVLTKAYQRCLLEMISTHGGFVTILSHSTAEFSEVDWEALLDLLEDEYPDVVVGDVDTIVDTIRTGGLWATSDNRTYTRSWTDEAADYHLTASSPCIDAGVIISGRTTDRDGQYTPQGTAMDIGNYEWTVANQRAADEAEVAEHLDEIDGGIVILEQEGTGLNATTLTAALGNYASTLAAALATASDSYPLKANVTQVNGVAAELQAWSAAVAEMSAGILVTPANKLATDSSGQVTAVSALGTTIVVGPTAAANNTPLAVKIPKNGTKPLSARIILSNGNDATIASIASITYSIYSTCKVQVDDWTVVPGHDAVSITPSAVMYDTVRTDALASSYNFRHEPDIITYGNAFEHIGTPYVVEYKLTPAAGGQVIIVRFSVTVI